MLSLMAVLLMELAQTPPGDAASACGSATSEAVECGSAQGPASLGEVRQWIHLTKEQSPPGLVISAEHLSGTLELLSCAEAIYTKAGVDVVTESQWDLILTVIVSPEGLIERFRIVHQPSIGIDFLGPTKEALMQWRYRPVIFEGRAKPVYLTLGLPKPLGSKTSAACADSLKGDSPCRTTASLPMVASDSRRRSAQK